MSGSRDRASLRRQYGEGVRRAQEPATGSWGHGHMQTHYCWKGASLLER